MCFDPISLALLAASTAASVGGGIISRNEAQANAERVANARNAELRDTLARQKVLQDKNNTILDSTLSKFDQPVQEQKQQDAVDQRTADITGNAVAPTPDASDIPLAGNVPKVITGGIADRMKTAFDQATDKAKAVAKLGSYNDTFGGNNRDIMGGGRGIDTNNSFSRVLAGLLPSLQDLSGYAVNKPSSGVGETLSALGQVGAAAAGGGAVAPKVGAGAVKSVWDATNPFLLQQPTSI